MQLLLATWRRCAAWFVAAIAAASIAAACGSDTASSQAGAGAAAAGSGGMGGAGFATGTSASGSSSSGEGGSCAGEVQSANLLPLDMYLMLDRSLSMEEDTAVVGTTKWEAVLEALTAFVNDSGSQGIGVGIQYFPPNLPCTQHSDCPGSSCYRQVCNNTPAPQPCQSDADCPEAAPDSCAVLGRCGAATCSNLGTTCGNGLPCILFAHSVCIDDDICAVSDYATPSVPITPLPGAAATIVASLDDHHPAPLPYGFTPTGPALQGAVDHAQAWATTHPTHRVIVVLATDGSPTQCAPTGSSAVAAIAAVGLHTSPSVQTFTIGVFAPGDMIGPANIEAIADSGGGQAFVVDAMGSVTQQFIAALNAIRAEAATCEYELPDPPAGEQLDFGEVNVELTDPQGNATPVLYVGGVSNCDPTSGGWYYDVNPAEGTPSKIILCDASCERLEEVGTTIAIVVGCDTIIVPE
jgi:hypothetical protein